MQRTAFLFDGLSRCLCPGVDQRTLGHLVAGAPLLTRRENRPQIAYKRRCANSARPLALSQKRTYPTDSASPAAASLPRGEAEPENGPASILPGNPKEVGDNDDESTHLQGNLGETSDTRWPMDGESESDTHGLSRIEVENQSLQSAFETGSILLTKQPPSEWYLEKTRAKKIFAALQALRHPRPGGDANKTWTIDRLKRARVLAEYLLRQRTQHTDGLVFECIMDIMADPSGSASSIGRIIRQMGFHKLVPTQALCQKALAVLTVHPSHVARLQVMDVMEQLWYALDPHDTQHVLLGMLREQQYELAYLRLTDMIQQGNLPELWVVDIFVVVFGKLGFFDEMLALLAHRKSADEEDKTLQNLMSYALDVCSEAFHYTGTVYAWMTAVSPKLLRPADGIVENVLSTAARHGDSKLAAEAVEVLAERVRLEGHHYEALAEAFLKRGKMSHAVRVYFTMEQKGYPVLAQAMGELNQVLRRRPADLDAAKDTVREEVASRVTPPKALVACIIGAEADKGNGEAAHEFYREAQHIFRDKPNMLMAQTLLMRASTPELKKQLVADLGKLLQQGAAAGEVAEVPLPAEAYSELISRSLDAEAVDVACHFAKLSADARAGLGSPAEPWMKRLCELGISLRDRGILAVLDRFEQANDKEACRVMRWAMRHGHAQERLRQSKADFGGGFTERAQRQEVAEPIPAEVPLLLEELVANARARPRNAVVKELFTALKTEEEVRGPVLTHQPDPISVPASPPEPSRGRNAQKKAKDQGKKAAANEGGDPLEARMKEGRKAI